MESAHCKPVLVTNAISIFFLLFAKKLFEESVFSENTRLRIVSVVSTMSWDLDALHVTSDGVFVHL